MWKQPAENKKELRESYLKMPPEALLIRKMGPISPWMPKNWRELNGFGNGSRKNSFCPQKEP